MSRRFLYGVLACGMFLFVSAIVPTRAQAQGTSIGSFGLEAQGKFVGTLKNCSSIGSRSDVVEYKTIGPGGTDIIQKIPGQLHWLDITCERGLNDNLDLATWRKMVENGDVHSARTNGTITVYDTSGTPIARWNFINAWPSQLNTGPRTLVSDPNDHTIYETLTLVCEGVVRVATQ